MTAHGGHLIRKVEGGYVLSPEGVAVIYDVPVSEALLHLANNVFGPNPLPEHWTRGYGRWCRETYAATGSLHIVDGLRYWAAAHLDENVTVIVDANGNEI